MFNDKRIKELEKSVRALTDLVDKQSNELYGYKFTDGTRSTALVARMDMLVKYLGVEYVPSTATLPSYQKIKKEKK